MIQESPAVLDDENRLALRVILARHSIKKLREITNDHDFEHAVGTLVFEECLKAHDAHTDLFRSLDRIPCNYAAPGFADAPETSRRGYIIPVTQAAIEADDSAKLLTACAQVGKAMAISREKNIRAFVDANPGQDVVFYENWPLSVMVSSDKREGIIAAYKVTSRGYPGLRSWKCEEGLHG